MAEKMAKLSVSVGSDAVDWIDEQIEKRVYRNRSHAMDVAAHLLMETVKQREVSPNEAAFAAA